MSKISLFFVFLSLVMYSNAVGDRKTKDKDLAKSTTSSYKVTEDENSEDTVKIPVEGQSKPLKLNIAKNSTKDKLNRSSRIVPRKNAPKITSLEKSENGSSPLVNQTVNTSLQNISLVINTTNDPSSTIRSTRKRKPKQRVTVGDQDADMPIPTSSTEQSPVGTSRKMNYIIPAAITLTTLPLMGAVFYILYKRGRDYWDKRHYRRMDFLINGMYNE